MRIGIVDAEIMSGKKHRFPNLASMKISAYHKENGDHVQLLRSYDEVDYCDKVYVSKVFDFTEAPNWIQSDSRIVFGGSGFHYDLAPPLPHEIEHHMPDYHLYDDWVESQIVLGAKRKDFSYYTDFSIGYMTRGCIRRCSFCINRNEKQSSLHSVALEFVDQERPYICLLDDNIFACREWKAAFHDLQRTNKPFQFKQGCDERLMNEEMCTELFSKSKLIGDVNFAFDNIKDCNTIVQKLRMIRSQTKRNIKFYLFCAYNHEQPGKYDDGFWASDIADLFDRIVILMIFRCLPYVMKYKDYEDSPYRGMYITIARWCNQPNFYRKLSFREFCEAHGGKSSSVRYMTEFERQNPEIACEYFDLKYAELSNQSGI